MGPVVYFVKYISKIIVQESNNVISRWQVESPCSGVGGGSGCIFC